MARRPDFAAQLRKLASSLTQIAASLEDDKGHSELPRKANGRSGSGRTRRSKKEVAELKKLLRSERKAGVPVAELSAKHGVTTAYIYMLQ